MDFVAPLVGADGVAVECIHHGIAASLVFRVAGRQKDKDVTVYLVAFKIAFECGAVNLYVLHRDRLCAGHRGRYLGLDLRQDQLAAG
jgi:hypothetical protein